jgi:hypothetical protein
MSKTGFHDPIEDKPVKKSLKTPWNFEQPQYDDRTRIFAGTRHVVGHRNPVGHDGPVKGLGVVPQGRVKTMSTLEHNDPVEMQR